MTADGTPSPATPPQTRLLQTKLGWGAVLGTAGAAIAAIPAAVRGASQGAPIWACYLVAAFGAASLLAPVGGCLRMGRPLPPGALAVGIGVGLSLGPLAVLATVLKENTHHRPLGGATFGIVAGLVVGVSIVFVYRLLRLSRSGAAPLRRVARLGVRALASTAVALSVILLFAAYSVSNGSVRSGLLDGALLSTFGALAAFVPANLGRVTNRAGAAAALVWAGLFVAACWAFRLDAVRRVMVEQAPAMLGVLWLAV